MKSKQINFYITPEDSFEINNFLRDAGCMILKENVKKTHSDFVYEIITDIRNNIQLYLCKEEYMSCINVESLKSDKYYIDILKSQCIEFAMGGFYPYSDKELHRSRFYYIFEYYQDGQLIRKDAKFINWADDLFKKFKKEFLIKTDTFPRLLLSANCLSWINANNAKLAGGGMKFILS